MAARSRKKKSAHRKKKDAGARAPRRVYTAAPATMVEVQQSNFTNLARPDCFVLGGWEADGTITVSFEDDAETETVSKGTINCHAYAMHALGYSGHDPDLENSSHFWGDFTDLDEYRDFVTNHLSMHEIPESKRDTWESAGELAVFSANGGYLVTHSMVRVPQAVHGRDDLWESKFEHLQVMTHSFDAFDGSVYGEVVAVFKR